MDERPGRVDEGHRDLHPRAISGVPPPVGAAVGGEAEGLDVPEDQRVVGAVAAATGAAASLHGRGGAAARRRGGAAAGRSACADRPSVGMKSRGFGTDWRPACCGYGPDSGPRTSADGVAGSKHPC